MITHSKVFISILLLISISCADKNTVKDLIVKRTNNGSNTPNHLLPNPKLDSPSLPALQPTHSELLETFSENLSHNHESRFSFGLNNSLFLLNEHGVKKYSLITNQPVNSWGENGNVSLNFNYDYPILMWPKFTKELQDGSALIGISRGRNLNWAAMTSMLGLVNAKGTFDNSISTTGFVDVTFDLDVKRISQRIQSAEVTADSKIIITGYSCESYDSISDTNCSIGLVRYSKKLRKDMTFGIHGNVTLPDKLRYRLNNIQTNIDSIGHIYVYYTDGNKFVTRRLTPDGAIDLSYGDAGRTIVYIDNAAQFSACKLKNKLHNSNDTTFIGLTCPIDNSPFSKEFWVFIKLNNHGNLDNSFGDYGVANFYYLPIGGWYTVNQDNNFFSSSMGFVIDAKGGLIIADRHHSENSKNPFGYIFITRLLPNGKIDSTFRKNGFEYFEESGNILDNYEIVQPYILPDFTIGAFISSGDYDTSESYNAKLAQ